MSKSKKKKRSSFLATSPEKGKVQKIGSVPHPFSDKAEVFIEDGKIYIKE